MREELPVRKKIRLGGYDYHRNGAYYITLCVIDRHEMLGSVGVGAIINRPPPTKCVTLSQYGEAVDDAIRRIPQRFQDVEIDTYVIMPNHIHMILLQHTQAGFAESGGRLIIAPTSVSTVAQQCKRSVTRQLGFSLWQKSFFDHIIRDAAEHQRIRQYIVENPQKWEEDEYHPSLTAVDEK